MNAILKNVIYDIAKTSDSLAWADFSSLTTQQDCELEILERKFDLLEEQAYSLSVPELVELMKNMPLGLEPDYLASRVVDIVYASTVFLFPRYGICIRAITVWMN